MVLELPSTNNVSHHVMCLAIFAFRDSSFLSGLSAEQLNDFVEPQNEVRVGFIKSKLRSKFPVCEVAMEHFWIFMPLCLTL